MESSKKQPEKWNDVDGQKAAALFNGLVKILQGQPGHIAMAAAVNLVVYGARGVGVDLDHLIKTIKSTWEHHDKHG